MPLCPLRPFIYFVTSVGARPGPVHYDTWQARCWALWHQRTGLTRLSAGDRQWTLRPDDVFVAGPGVGASWQAEATLVRIVFDPLYDKPHTQHGPPPSVPQPDAATLFGHDIDPLVPIGYGDDPRPLIREIDSGLWRDPFIRLDCSLRLGLWLLRYARCHAPAQAPCELDLPPLVQRAEWVMSQGLKRRITVAEVAQTLGLSSSVFIRRYTAARGHPPGVHLTRLRLEKAREMLAVEDGTIDSIARFVGFASARGLYQAFVREYGTTPSAWRRQARS